MEQYQFAHEEGPRARLPRGCRVQPSCRQNQRSYTSISLDLATTMCCAELLPRPTSAMPTNHATLTLVVIVSLCVCFGARVHSFSPCRSSAR